MSPPASVTITQLEPVIFLRGQSSSGEDARGRRRPVDFDAPPSQLRALVTLHLPKPSKIKEISISLKGTARTDWPEGIGPNRVEMVEEMTIFQHSISLFNAKDANDSVPRARPRSNSVGPGIGLQEDVDWDYAAAAASARTSARQPSASVPRPINTTGRRDEEGSRSPGSQGQSSSNLARQIALGAAKAGSAIIPPTLRPDLSHMKLRDSPTSPSHLRPPARPPLHRTGSGTTSWTSEQTSPDLESTSPRLSPTANFSGSWTRGGAPTNGSATSPQDMSRWHDYFESQGYERPPLYAPRSAPLQGYDSWPTELPSDASAAAPQVAGPDSQATSLLGSVSSSAAPSTSTTPLDRSAANSAQGLARLNAALTAVAQPRSKPTAAAQSASPPSTAPGRSILHTQSPSVPRSKEQTVRFDPQSRVDNAAAAAASNASNNKSSGTRSNPSSRRSSMELDKNSLKGKLSSKSGHDAKGKKPGLKNLINGLLKEPAADSKTPNEELALSDSKEFKKGTYTYPISISLPSNLPPTLHADFGFNRYILRAHVVRSGALTPNLVAEREVTLIHAPDEDALEETDAIVVERCWEDLLSYMVVFSGKSLPVGQKIPLWLKFVPLGKVKIYRILATLEERTDYFAKGRRVARHEVPRKWTLLKIGHTSSAEPILPVVSDSADALDKSPLAPLARAAANEDEDSDALASILDPTGPWELATELPIPAGASTRINLSTNHSKSNIAVHHLVRLSIRVGRSQGEWQVWSDGAANSSSSAKPAPQLYDIIIEAPITLNHSHTASEWTALPNYWSLPAEPEDADSARASPEREAAPTRPALPLPVLTSRTGLVGQSHGATPSRGPGGENSPTGSPPMSRNPTQLSRRWLALSADQNARDGSAPAGSNGGSAPPPAYQANARTGERTVASTSMSRSPSTADNSEATVRDASGPPASTSTANANGAYQVGMAH
ncbi:thioredoxin binding protein TBP-2/VDUP1 [Moesziomyces antarcticus T-34]|uniref:Thioredoxin binding protein TBP-2/VDUP1 n=1 Tax=Pseudozyma antarctica (strain T-34) TaxID=1151754 RepID=M9M7C2_PSEA3|nr:thioredoxin binding protein TBP-2/VDUP1 [Moesziomyces antarcticus T-34]